MVFRWEGMFQAGGSDVDLRLLKQSFGALGVRFLQASSMPDKEKVTCRQACAQEWYRLIDERPGSNGLQLL
ncbi:hypothetical protein SynBIOSE41_03790 [Synechococcus sp. BIOS-E4-1]|nr:hypothetical protein SynBIOSE41_03790 [Synechococcus sp. BIOS-E4-1]